MRITIIGASNMGRGIGTRAIAGGHDVEIVDSSAEEVGALVPSGTAVVKAFNTTFAGTLVACEVARTAARRPHRR
jgi:8-hydroxy-5-deazaflavin:NADPH oxidoreductase